MISTPELLQFKLLTSPFDDGYSDVQTDSRGNNWHLKVACPDVHRGDGEWVHVCLTKPKYDESDYDGTRETYSRCSIILRNASGEVHAEEDMEGSCVEEHLRPSWVRLVRLSEVFDRKNDILVGGALLLDVHFQFKGALYSNLHKPRSSLSGKMLQLLENGEDSDVSFEVDDSVFAAHKLILKMNAPVLFDFCPENDDGSPPVVVPIEGTTPKIFRTILRYVYGEEVPPEIMGTIAADTETVHECKHIIDAADRYGIVGLKLATEAALVESMMITSKNVVDWLVFADSKTCPLLKEQATAYFLTRSRDILESESSKHLRESPELLTELMIQISTASSSDGGRFGVERIASVDELRKQLDEKGLDIDGSKEMLISRLRESNKGGRDD